MAKKKSPTGEVSVLGAVTTVAREVRKHKMVAESAPRGQGANVPPAPKRSPEELKRDIRAGRDELAREPSASSRPRSTCPPARPS
ncbi:hypothetical protein [Clavibacter zhangzhiyongii]|uniref:hypothetical protein n=1 Tax=Clavibacter zhangzhiyongii TaxID=2768071 RepID=UPI0039E016DF